MLQNAFIVVVDDEPDVLSMVSEYLERDGYNVSRCSSGAELDRTLETGRRTFWSSTSTCRTRTAFRSRAGCGRRIAFPSSC